MTWSSSPYRLTTHPSKEETWTMQPLRIFRVEYRGSRWKEEDTSRGIAVRNLSARSIRLLEEITPAWGGLDEHPDIRAMLVSEFRKANGNEEELPEWASLRNLKLRGVTLENLQLFGTDWRGSDLSKAQMSRATLNYSDLRGCTLNGTDLQSAGAEGAEFSGAKLNDATLSSAVLEGAHFRGAEMRRVKCNGTTFTGADLRDCDLRGAEFHYAQLGQAYLAGANLSGASFDQANLSETDLRGVKISSRQLADCGWLEGISLKGAIVDGRVLDDRGADRLLSKLRRNNPGLFLDQEVA